MPSRSIFLFICCVILAGNGGGAQSPCPDYFQYRSDENGVYGIIHIVPKERVHSITTEVNFTVATRLSSSYVGKLKTLESNELKLIQEFNRGVPIDYQLLFPVSSPVPRITSIVVNGDLVCSGPPDRPAANQYVTSVSLNHKLYLENTGPSILNDNNVLNTMPISGFTGIKPDFHTFTFESNRPTWNTNTSPFVIINNSKIDIEELDRRKQIPYDLSMFFQNSRPSFTENPWNTIMAWQTEIPSQTTRPQTPTTRQEIPPTTVRTTTTTRVPKAPRPGSNECGVNSNIDSVPLVYNGMGYTRGDWPWLVAIFKRKDIGVNYVCSGTLISNRHVLTAAHCMHSKTTLTSIRDIVVKAGVHNILDWDDDDATVTRILANATIHDSYNASTLANDILMLTFTRPVEFNSYIKPVCLWSGNADLALIVGAAGVVTGWGVSEIGPAGRGEPRMVRMPVVSTATCRASKPDFHRLTSSKTLCAGDRNGAGPCLGDSGGGLYMLHNGRWKLRGIVSLSLVSQTGDMSCNLNDYIVFTDAAQYLPWINRIMSANQ